MRVVTLPQSPVAASSPRSPNIRTPTSSPKAPAPVSRFIQQAAASPKVAQSPQRALLGSPARVASPIQQESSPSSIQVEPRGRNLIKSFSVTFMNAMAAKEAKMSSPATAGSAGPTSTAAVPTVVPSMIPTPSLEDLQLNLSDTEDYLGSNPASPSDGDSDGDDSFPSPPPVPSTILTSFLMRSASISPSNTQSEAPMAASPALQPTEASNLGPLGRLGAPMRVQKAEFVAEIAEAVDDEFEEPPAPKLSSLAMTRPVIQKSSSMASRTAISAKNPIKIAGKPPAASSMAPAVSSKAPSNPRGVPTLEKPPPKASAPIPVVSNSSAKQKPTALGQAARKPPAPVLPPQPPQQPSTITKRKTKVIYTPASSAAQEENLENLADPWLSQPKPTAPARKFGKLGVEVDESMIQMVREHNKKFAPKPAYEPRKFSLHEIRAVRFPSHFKYENINLIASETYSGSGNQGSSGITYHHKVESVRTNR
jgi:hypothetical protein